MDQIGEQITESELEQNHITAIVANMELEDSADGMLGPVTSETGRTRSQHSLLYVYRTDTLTVERIIMRSLVLILADAKIRHGVNDFRVRRITQDNSEPDREHRHGLAMVEREPRAVHAGSIIVHNQ